jgi:hypothetical protein
MKLHANAALNLICERVLVEERTLAEAAAAAEVSAGAAFEVPTLVDFTTIAPPGRVNTGRTIRPR